MPATNSASPWLWNRLVTFAGPYLAIASGALASWLVHNLPGLHLQQQGTAAELSSAAVFLGGTFVTWALQQKWLDGWQKWEHAAALLATQVVPDPIQAARTPAGQLGTVPVVDDLATAVTEVLGQPIVDGITLLPPS